jgi:hypothetical protein
MKIKRFNEEIDNSKLLEFYNEYKNLFVGEYDSGDLYDTIGDLCVQHYMTKQEVKQVLDTFDCSFDMDKLLKETYDNWIDDEIVSDSKIITGNNFRIDISDFEKLSREVGYYNAKSNIKDEDDNYDEEAISKYEKLREEQLDMLEELIKFYSK